MKIENENARRAPKGDWRFRKRNSAPRSNPRPGTKISKPVFGYELFVAHLFYRAERERFQAPVIHKTVIIISETKHFTL
jgi:hypothetical protein